MRLAHQKQEFNFQRLKPEDEGQKKEQALVICELEKDDRTRLVEAALSEL